MLYYLWCFCIGLIGGTCDQRKPCLIVNSKCVKGFCRCKKGYMVINDWNNFCDIAPPTTGYLLIYILNIILLLLLISNYYFTINIFKYF